jgi:hypothetical protein
MPYEHETGQPGRAAAQERPCDFSATDQVALRAQALRCRRLADSIDDPRTLETLATMAADYEARARMIEAREG